MLIAVLTIGIGGFLMIRPDSRKYGRKGRKENL